MKITGCCLPYGESKYHDAVQVGAFSHQDGERVPLLRDFGRFNDPSNIIGYCILHDTTTGAMCDVYFNPEYIKGIDIRGWCSHNRIGAWVVEVKREPMLLHKLPSKFGNKYIVTHGRIKAVVFNEDCLEKVIVEEEEE